MMVWIAPLARSRSSVGGSGTTVGANRCGGGDRVVDAVGRRPLVDGVEQPAELEVGELALVPQRPGELGAAVADAGETADQLHADAGERVEVERGAFGRAGELHRRHAARPHDVVDLVVALVEHAGRLHPPVDVATPVHRAARERALPRPT